MSVTAGIAEVARDRARHRSAVTQPRRSRLLDAAVIAGPAAVALALCCYDLTARSLGFDEGATFAIVSQHGGALGSAIAHDGGNMSGYYALLHVLIAAFGSSLVVLRLPSALATAATVALLSGVALRLFGRRVAFTAGVLCAVSLPLVFWGQSARGYALMVAFATASFYAFIVLVDGTGSMVRRRAAWIAYFVTLTVALYMGFVAVLVVPAQLVLLIWRRRALPAVLAALGLTALCAIPLVVLAAQRGAGQLFWVPRPTLDVTKQVLESLSAAGLQPSFHATSTTLALLVLTCVAVVVLAVLVMRELVRRPSAPRTWASVLVLSWAVVPLVLAGLQSLFGQSIFLPRNLLMSTPAVSLLLACGLANKRVFGWSLLAAVLALRILQLAPSYGASPENWRAATSYVLAHSSPRDCIAFYPSDSRMAFDYYVRAHPGAGAAAPRPILPTAPFTQVRPYVEQYVAPSPARIAALPAQCPRLWLVSSHQGQRDGPAAARAHNARYQELRAELARQYPRRQSHSFGWASPARVELLAR